MTNPLIQRFPDEHYTVIFNPTNGFFARIEDDGFPEPSCSAHGPELIDIAITNWCDHGCARCYRNSSPNGFHMSLRDYESIIQQAAALGTLQVALGGGNPNQHPEFGEILEITRAKYGIVPNYTTNGRGLSADILSSSAKYCGAVAVSAYPPYGEMEAALRQLLDKGIRTNIHFVLDANHVDKAIEWLRNPPPIFHEVNAIIFLNYKPVGRLEESILLNHSPKVEEFFSIIADGKFPFRIGFDSCMVSGLVSYLPKVSPSLYDACEAGRFSMFVSERMEAYPCSFMESHTDGVPLTEHNMLEIWCESDLFCETRKMINDEHCPDCNHKATCLGGCPAFNEINLCRSDAAPAT